MKDQIISEGAVLTDDQQLLLTYNIITEDVTKVILSVPNDEAPGIDGFNNFFYKQSWGIVGKDVTDAVLDFFPKC